MYMFGKTQKRIYLDHASATPVSKEVLRAMKPYWSEHFANASAVHQEGVLVRSAIEAQRERLAQQLRVREQGIVFTGNGTESNNLAIFGTLRARHAEGVAYADMEIVTTALEHASVTQALKEAEAMGASVIIVPVDEAGLIQMEAFKKALTPKTVLVTCAYANSEIGVVQHINRLARAVRAHEKTTGTRVYVHADGAQAPLYLPCALDALGIDLLSLDAGKCEGPKGIGVLAFRYGVKLMPHTFGGSQEGGLRPGTEATPLIVGAVEALVRAQHTHQKRSEKVRALRDFFVEQLLEIEGAVLNGSATQRIAHNVNISIPGIDAEFAVVTLDGQGIACSTKSACGSASGSGSAVVRALSGDEARANATIRFSLSEKTTRAELRFVAQTLKTHVTKMRTFHSAHAVQPQK